jgi:predicted ATPase
VPARTRELAHPNTAAVALAWGCIFHQLLRNRTRAGEQAQAVMELATQQGFPLYLAAGMVVHGWALAEGGRAAEGVAGIRRGLAAYAATGAEMWSPYFLGLLAEALGWAGQAAAGLDTAGDALQRVERTGASWIEADLHRLRGELLLAQPEPDRAEAEASFRRSLAVARAQGAKLWGLRAATRLAKLHSEQGRRADARDLLASVHGWFTEGFETPDLRAAGMLLEELR